MSELHAGEVRDARVVGFLPGRRVVLEMAEALYVAWTNLPLVRDSRVRVRVEPGNGAMRLRVVGEGAEATPSASSDLHDMVAGVGRRIGIAVDTTLAQTIVEQLKTLHAPLREGYAPLDELEEWVRDALRAHARHLEPSLHAWTLMRGTAHARLGVGVSRLAEALAELVPVERALQDDAARLRSFFVDLEQPLTRSRLETALASCCATEPGTPSALETCLNAIRARLEARGEPHEWPAKTRRARERAGAWVRRLIEITAATQAQNANPGPHAESVTHTQVPARSASGAGTLYVFRGPRGDLVWTDVATPHALGGFVPLAAEESTSAPLKSRPSRAST